VGFHWFSGGFFDWFGRLIERPGLFQLAISFYQEVEFYG
jgi:hypothetical protein